ncbi:MAG: 1-(5-phosphoribosyl)-5-[(5-phosphoribosylamino)methylideneamino]imidazole-4-carboxamide isomerase [Cytophaga sp.]|uniref:1-(5-phosphoribosyl)-5-[(5- phosphoribosylamino)methylideneamino]imidazole-4- carboxamide isomerase n=1 Tax=Cytophaga sp. TaxID=29535 RepID=UPI003F80179E
MIQIIPAIDIIDGKCVRLTQGDYNQKKEYHSNPVEVAKMFENAGIERLHLVDLDGAKQKKIVNYKVLENISGATKLSIDFGGGLQSDEDLQIAFNSGAKQITAGSIAVKDPEKVKHWLTQFGKEKIILGADTKAGMIAVHGWQETSDLSIQQLMNQFIPYGISYSICTDVAKDGLLQGPSFDLYKKLGDEFSQINWIASGGVAEFADIEKLNDMGIYGVIVGKAFYEGKITLQQLAQFNA